MKRLSVPEFCILLVFVCLMLWKVKHPYTSYGCDGWGEYRKVPEAKR